MTNTRDEVIEFYERETGLNAKQGEARIDRLVSFIEDNNLLLKDISIENSPNKMKRDYNRGVKWNAGTQHDEQMLIGYTSDMGYWNYKNAIFVSIK